MIKECLEAISKLGLDPEGLDLLPRRDLRRKREVLLSEVQHRSEAVRGAVHLIERLWSLLQTPIDERFPLDEHDLRLATLQHLEQEKRRLIVKCPFSIF